MRDGSLIALLRDVAVALDDIDASTGPKLSVSSDGLIGRWRAVESLVSAQREVVLRLLDYGVYEPLVRRAELEESSSDTSAHVLPPRTVRVYSIEDANGVAYRNVYSRLRSDEAGFIIRNGHVEWFNMARPTTAYAWVAEEPARMSYGTVAASSSTTVTLAASPTYGVTIDEDDYYVGATIECVGGTRVITDYDAATRVAVVDTAWESPPGTNTAYSICASVPRVALPAVVACAALRIARVYMALEHRRDALMLDYEEAFLRAATALSRPGTGPIQPRRVIWWRT